MRRHAKQLSVWSVSGCGLSSCSAIRERSGEDDRDAPPFFCRWHDGESLPPPCPMPCPPAQNDSCANLGAARRRPARRGLSVGLRFAGSGQTIFFPGQPREGCREGASAKARMRLAVRFRRKESDFPLAHHHRAPATPASVVTAFADAASPFSHENRNAEERGKGLFFRVARVAGAVGVFPLSSRRFADGAEIFRRKWKQAQSCGGTGTEGARAIGQAGALPRFLHDWTVRVGRHRQCVRFAMESF
jgi:hypothetical protein